jgi:hypothetical protein
MNSAPSSVPLPLNPSTYGSSFASAFSVRHPNFDSGSLDNADFIRGGFLSCHLHIYTPELGVFYLNIDLEHHHLFPSDLVYKQLTRTGWLVVHLEQLDNIPDTPVFEFALLTDCLVAVKCSDLVHIFTQGNMAGGVIDRQVSSTDTTALFLVHSYWFPRESPFHVSGWFHVRVLARFAQVLGHATDNQRNHWFITNKTEGKQPKSFRRFYSKLLRFTKYHSIYLLRQRGSTPRCVLSTHRGRNTKRGLGQ